MFKKFIRCSFVKIKLKDMCVIIFLVEHDTSKNFKYSHAYQKKVLRVTVFFSYTAVFIAFPGFIFLCFEKTRCSLVWNINPLLKIVKLGETIKFYIRLPALLYNTIKAKYFNFLFISFSITLFPSILNLPFYNFSWVHKFSK